MADEPDAPELDTENDSQSQSQSETPPEAKPETPDLGDAGKAAIKAERDQRRRAEREAKELKARLEAIEAESLTETERAIAQARAEATAEAMTVANSRILRAEVIAAAAGKLSDPADAAAFLDLSKFEVDDDGEVDREAISTAIEELVEAKPYLSATHRPTGTGGGGARPITEPPSVDQQIRELEAKGDHRAAMHLKNRGLAAALLNQST